MIYRVMWTGIIELVADDFDNAIKQVKSNYDLLLRESKFGSVDQDGVSYIPQQFKAIPSYGDLIPIDEFLEDIRHGNFVDYDGSGHYALVDKVSNIKFRPSTFDYDYAVKNNFTHVVWYNR